MRSGLRADIEVAEHFTAEMLQVAPRSATNANVPPVYAPISAQLLPSLAAPNWFWDRYAACMAPLPGMGRSNERVDLIAPVSDDVFKSAWATYRDQARSSEYQPMLHGELVDDDGIEAATRRIARDLDLPEPLHVRDLVLARMVQAMARDNRRFSQFALTPDQLEAIYTFTAIFYDQKDIDHWAEVEFSSDLWQPLLRWPAPDPVRGMEPNRRRSNHLDWANHLIRAEAVAHFAEVLPKRQPSGGGDTRQTLSILEIGFGVLRTLAHVSYGLQNELPDRLAQHGESSVHPPHVSLDYLGCDINSKLHGSMAQIFGSTDAHERAGLNRIRRLGAEYWSGDGLVHKSAHDFLCSPRRSKLIGDGVADIFLASYVMHHIFMPSRIFKALKTGALFDFIGHAHFRNEEGLHKLRTSILEGHIFHYLKDDRAPAFFAALCEAYWDFVNRRPDRQTRIEEVFVKGEWFDDQQLDIMRGAFAALRSGGMFLMADPNGFSSTFNRHQILVDWPIAVAHFTDWPTVAYKLHQSGFRDIKVMRQLRSESMDVIEYPVSGQVLAKAIAGQAIRDHELEVPAELAEVKDYHLGYVIAAKKP